MAKPATPPSRAVTVRDLVRQKSDGEMARLLRRSFQLRRRKRSRHRGTCVARWTEAEIQWLGRRPDGELARYLDRSVPAVHTKRCSLKIPCFRPPPKRWTAEALALLGKVPDRELAKRLS